MESAEYGDCVDESFSRERPWNRLFVAETLVRTRFVVEAHVLGDDAPEVILTEDEDMVEQLSAERADEAFSEGIHIRRAYRRAHNPHPRRPEYASETYADGKIEKVDFKTGDVKFLEPFKTAYVSKNEGKSDIQFYVVQLK